MANCIHYKADLIVCDKLITDNPEGHTYNRCKQHRNIYLKLANVVGHLPEGKCIVQTPRSFCTHDSEQGINMCGRHLEDMAQKQETVIIKQYMVQITIALINAVPRPDWREVVNELVDPVLHVHLSTVRRKKIAKDFYLSGNTDEHIFENYWAWRNLRPHRQQQQPRQRPDVQLRDIARDSENVHTPLVNNQTNQKIEILLKEKILPHQYSRRELTVIWNTATWAPHFGNFMKTMNDINQWYNTESCRAPNDNLYKRVFVGLVARIKKVKDESIRDELWKRLWEECYDSLGVCGDGHIARLCNVLTGFDSLFEPEIPIGEQIQNEMSKISNLELSETEKIKLATEFFDKHNIPNEGRQDWLDAF